MAASLAGLTHERKIFAAAVLPRALTATAVPSELRRAAKDQAPVPSAAIGVEPPEMEAAPRRAPLLQVEA